MIAITPDQWYVLVFVISSVATLMAYSIYRIVWGYWPPSMLELTVRGLRRFEAWHRTWRTYKPAKVIHVRGVKEILAGPSDKEVGIKDEM